MKQTQNNFISIMIGISSLFALCPMHGAADPQKTSQQPSKKPKTLVNLSMPQALSKSPTIKSIASPDTPDVAEDEEITQYMPRRSITPQTTEKSPSITRSTPWKSLTSPSSRASTPGIYSPALPSRCSSITEIQQAEQKLHDTSPHESQFQSPDKLIHENFFKPVAIPNPTDEVSCGAATVQMALKMLRHQGTIAKTEAPSFSALVEIFNIEENQAVHERDIIKFFQNYPNLHCSYKRISKTPIDGLDTIIEHSTTIPTIANTHYYAGSSENPVGHFVLLQGEDDAFVLTCDPWEDKEITYIPKARFYQTCVATIQIQIKCRSGKSRTASVRRSESSQPRPSSRLALLPETDA